MTDPLQMGEWITTTQLARMRGVSRVRAWKMMREMRVTYGAGWVRERFKRGTKYLVVWHKTLERYLQQAGAPLPLRVRRLEREVSELRAAVQDLAEQIDAQPLVRFQR